MKIISSKYREREQEATVLIHETANSTIKISGNNSVSNVNPSTTNTATVTSANINRVWHGSGNTGYWKVVRNSNTVGVYNNTGYIEYNGGALNINKSDDIVVSLNGSTDGYIMLELKLKLNGTA